MKDYQPLCNQFLSDNGLNLQAVFNLADLPNNVVESDDTEFSQLILFGHAGRQLWSAIGSMRSSSPDPVDDFSRGVVEQFFAQTLPQHQYQIIYPGSQPIGLQRLGELAGWHHDSPFRIGINRDWGSWFAYRVAVIADTNLVPSEKIETLSPCVSCTQKPCISACPAEAMKEGTLALDACVNYRLTNDSLCKQTCLSRITCPVAQQHRYSEEQIRYHYGVSMKTIELYYRDLS